MSAEKKNTEQAEELKNIPPETLEELSNGKGEGENE